MRFILLFFVVLFSFNSWGAGVSRVEPLSWWTGMKTPLQLMLYGDDLQGFSVSFLESGLSAKSIHYAQNPNYLFIDVEVKPDAQARFYTLRLTRGSEIIDIKYQIEHRREGSADRFSFDSSDMVYLIMPDRFVNGDESNDSTEDTKEGVDRDNVHGRSGGDIQGVIDGLDYMQELGVTALWSTPLLLDDESTFSYHGYACSDYYKIDPRYGTNELYRKMVKSAHKRGIKVIMDVVINHAGFAHWWMRDLPFFDWVNDYNINSGNFNPILDPNSSAKDRSGTTDSWFDKPMPDLAIEKNVFLLHYFKQLFIWWIESADLDGLRVDTFPYNDKYAIANWTKSILDEYPKLNIVGECWSGIPAVTAYWDGGAKNHDGYNSNLPSVMDFSLQESVIAGLSSDTNGGGLMRIYNSLAQDFLYSDPQKLMIFVDNHDTPRLADMMNGDVERTKLALTLLATMRGVPQLYSGTEFLFRSSDMSQGHGSARVPFSAELLEVDGRDSTQIEIYDYTKKLFNWRKRSKVIHSGKLTHFIPDDNLYVYFRHNQRSAVMVIINSSDRKRVIDWDTYDEVLDRYHNVGYQPLVGSYSRVGDILEISAQSSIILEFYN